MADDIFRPQKITPSDLQAQENLKNIQFGENVRAAAAADASHDSYINHNSPEGLQITGNVPPGLVEAFNKQRGVNMQSAPQPASMPNIPYVPSGMGVVDNRLQELINKLDTNHYDEVQLPSLGHFYDDSNGPASGILHLRPMTGEEEQILATPRYIKSGKALDMIFSRCLKEKYAPEQLLSIDRTYLTIYLRGISYGSLYDVEIKCPSCERAVPTTINLDTIQTNYCPEGFNANVLMGELPSSKFKFSYRLSTGVDDLNVNNHRERKITQFSEEAAEDALIYKLALLLNDIEGISSKLELVTLLKRLKVEDLAYLRNMINDPPFGVDTTVPFICPACTYEDMVELPFEINFFFPKNRKRIT